MTREWEDDGRGELMSPADIDRIAPDSEDNLLRHWLFARYILGESMMDAVWIALRFRSCPLPVSAMRQMNLRWRFPELTPLGVDAAKGEK